MSGKVAVVTGANKGLGYGIVRELCRRGVSTVYLTARDKTRGVQAVENLKKEGYDPRFFQLDVCQEDTVKSFADYLKEKHNGLDILINNAAIVPEDFYKMTYEDSKRVIDTNYCSLLTVQKHIFPVLKDNARVVNISSDCGHISNLKNKYWIEKLITPNISKGDVDAFVNWFLDSVKNNTIKTEDFISKSYIAYRVSKVAVCALTRIQQNEIGRGISINSLHPGFVQTDMTSKMGLLTVEEASQAPVYLALDADQSLKGKYIWYDKSEKDWTDYKTNVFDNKILKEYLESIGWSNIL